MEGVQNLRTIIEDRDELGMRCGNSLGESCGAIDRQIIGI